MTPVPGAGSKAAIPLPSRLGPIQIFIHHCGDIRDREITVKITDVSKVVSGPNPHHVDARKVYECPHAIAVVITLLPGEALRKHITLVDVFFYVLEGTGVIEIGSEKQTVGKDMLVESPARIPHKWTNESETVFRVLVVKVPKPTEETKLL